MKLFKTKHRSLTLERKAGFLGPDWVHMTDKVCVDTPRNRKAMLELRDKWRGVQPNDEFRVVMREVKIKHMEITDG